MTTIQERRSQETKRAILSAAGNLFAERGYASVTMREIAKKARCSHTTIYLYFKDKEALLHQLSKSHLLELKQKLESILLQTDISGEDKVKAVSQQFVRFCLHNRNMYTIFFMTKATQVDDVDPALEINKLRIELFGLIKQALADCLSIQQSDDRLLAYSRIYFFTLHGIVGTYTSSEEPVEAVLTRLQPTFDDAVEVLLFGFQQKMKQGVEHE